MRSERYEFAQPQSDKTLQRWIRRQIRNRGEFVKGSPPARINRPQHKEAFCSWSTARNKYSEGMEAHRMSVSEMKALCWVHGVAVLLLLLPWAPCKGSIPTVTAVLHGTAVLPCSVPFISGTEDLLVSWVKKNGTKPSLVLHVFYKGQFDLTHQAPQYGGRTNMSPDLSNGRLDLTLTHVEHRDEGVYVCQVTNPADYRDIEVRLLVIVPVSDPLLSVSCRLDGIAEISCRAQNGSDPAYSLSVNGRIKLKDFHSSVSGSGVNITVSSAAPWNISCSVRNRISERNSSLISESCAESRTSGGYLGRYWMWISLGLLCTAGGLLVCYIFCRRRSSSADGKLNPEERREGKRSGGELSTMIDNYAAAHYMKQAVEAETRW